MSAIQQTQLEEKKVSISGWGRYGGGGEGGRREGGRRGGGRGWGVR